MKQPKKNVFSMLFFAGVLVFFILLMQPFQIYHFRDYIDILFPKGLIAWKERNLLFLLQILMLFVIVPVYILTFVFSWIYRADNPKGKYEPHLVDNRIAEYIWWGFPIVMTAIVCYFTWVKTAEMDPYKPIPSDKKPLTIQVVALQWKWLFIYPEEKIATVNFLQIPKETPIHFEITADAPMNSFWIPELGGQIYAMPRMKTELNLIANDLGDFRGSSANISGKGFAGMHFITRSSTEEDFHKWLATAKQSSDTLNFDKYQEIARPSEDNPVKLFRLTDDNLFMQIINKFMHPHKHE